VRLPILALFTRSLRVESRAITTYAKRLGLLAFVLLMLIIAYDQRRRVSASGLTFFASILYVNAAFITLVGMGAFASAITEEKEGDTLGLLKMTGLNTVALLLGKSTSRLLNVLMLVLVQAPFTLLAITLGGVSLKQVAAAYATLLAYTVLLANVALFFSVAFARTRQAVSACLFTMLVFLAAGPLGRVMVPGFVAIGWLDPMSPVTQWLGSAGQTLYDFNPFAQLYIILRTGFAGGALSTQVVSNLVIGAAFFALSWLTFDYFTREQKPAAQGRGFTFGKASPLRWLGVGRPGGQAIVWKDFHFLTGGRLLFVARFLAIPLCLFIVFRLIWQFEQRPVDVRAVGATTMVTALVFAAFKTLAHAARMFQDEVKWGTLPRLMMLPLSVGQVAGAKLVALLIALVPYAIIFLIGAALAPRDFGDATLEILGSPIGWFWLAQYITFLHLVACLSLTLKRSAAGVAIGAWVIGNIVLSLIFRPSSQAEFEGYCLFMSIVMAMLTVALIVWTGRRLARLAGQ